MAGLALWHDVLRYLEKPAVDLEAGELASKIVKAQAAYTEDNPPAWYELAVEAIENHGWDDVDKEIQENVDYEEMKTVLKDVLPAKKKFVGIKFCQECNNMLYPEQKQGRLVFACRNCEYFEHSADPCIYINRMVQDIDTLALISPDMASDPTLFRSRGKFEQCPRCGSDDSVFFQTLANREKSGMRLYFVCTRQECGHKWYSTDYANPDEEPEEVVP